MGNILFRLSNALAYALEHNYKVEDYTLAFCNYHDGSSNIRFFENYHSFHFFEYPRPNSRLINRIKWKFRYKNYRKSKMIENFDPSFDLKQLPQHFSYELKGFHFTAGDLIIKYRRQICQILDFKSSLKSPIDSLLKEARSKYSLILGVHIRENDFKDFYDGKYFVSAEHYLKLIDQFKKLKSENSVGVLICSDNAEILREIKQRYPDFTLTKGSVAQDMYALSLCDYILGPQATTMSAWAAYLGNVKLAQIRPETESIYLSSFQDVSRLEPFSPFSIN
ncbi:MAG: hypothetical protein VW576_00765 [Opitutae bacterium]